MFGPRWGVRRAHRRKIRAGRAVFNAAAEMCRRVHPSDLHRGNMCCGVCFEIMAFTLDNPSNGKRVDWWSDFVAERSEADESYKIDYYLKTGVMVPLDRHRSP